MDNPMENKLKLEPLNLTQDGLKAHLLNLKLTIYI